MKRTTSLVKKSQFKAILVKKPIRKNILWYFVSKIVLNKKVLVIEITLKFKAENLRSLDQFISKVRGPVRTIFETEYFFNFLLEVSQI